ncbi:MAG: oligosaccharide flippase family protein [Solirubrobacterales bacterium]|nr:oligosaccharide flippase family protein [Solirubrobacterales bacterium]
MDDEDGSTLARTPAVNIAATLPESRIASTAVDNPPGDLGDLLSTSDAGPAAVRGGGQRVGSFLGGVLISTGSAALLFRHLGVIDTGRYATAMSLAAVVTGFTDLGLTAIGMREFAVLEGKARADAARTLLGMRLVLTVLGVALISGVAFLLYGSLMGFATLIAGAGLVVQNTQVTLSVPLMAELRLGWVSLLELGRQLVIALLIVTLVLLGARLLPFMATAGIAAAVVLVPTIALVRGHIPLRASFRLREWRAMLAPIITYSAAAAAGALYFRVAIILVSLIAGAQALGYYSLSFRIVEVLLAVPALLVSSAFPIFARAARDDPERLGYALDRVFQVSLLLGVWIALSLGVGARLAILVVGGHKFLPAVPVLVVQGIGLGASFVGVVWAYGMLSLHLHRLILRFNLAMLLLVLILVSVLTSVDGARGAAIGTTVAELAGAVVGCLLLVRGRPHLVPSLRNVPRVLLAALVGAAPALLVGVPVIGRVALSTFSYALALLVLKAVPEELKVLLPRGMRSQGGG